MLSFYSLTLVLKEEIHLSDLYCECTNLESPLVIGNSLLLFSFAVSKVTKRRCYRLPQCKVDRTGFITA